MAGGRPPKPRELKKMQGTLRPDRELPDAMEPEKLVGVPVPPADLDEVGQTTWMATATQLHSLGVLSGLDLAMLKEYCYQISIMERAKIFLKDGLTIMMENKGGGKYEVKSPYIAIYNEALTHANRLAQQYGLTPSSRQKITANPKKDESKDPWSDL